MAGNSEMAVWSPEFEVDPDPVEVPVVEPPEPDEVGGGMVPVPGVPEFFDGDEPEPVSAGLLTRPGAPHPTIARTAALSAISKTSAATPLLARQVEIRMKRGPQASYRLKSCFL